MTLFTAPQTLKEYISQYKHQKEIFDLKERHDINELDLDTPNKNGCIYVHNSYIFGYNNNDNTICSLQT